MPDPTRTADHLARSVADPAATTTIGGAAAAAPDAPPPPGSRYALGEEIARGGMGVVYRATDTILGREVAVKVLQNRYTPDSGAARRFAAEGRITGQLQHPGIPPVHDLGTFPDGRPFLAMKLIQGETLDALLKARPDPGHDRGRFVAAFEQICHAVAYAHAHAIVHRDLKPANVMVGGFGEVQVMDWGLAKMLTGREQDGAPPEADPSAVGAGIDPDQTTDHRSRDESTDDQTRAGQVMGTPAYMPPEQARGDIATVDRRSDVFALGGVLCAVLTGQPPYVGHGKRDVVSLAAAGDLADALRRLDSCGADRELVALCARCLSPDPEHRPADAAEVAAQVGELRTAADERARQAEGDRIRAEAEAREQRKRRRVQLALAAAVGLLVVGGVVAAWWQDKQRAEAANRHSNEQDRLSRNTVALAALVGRCEAALQAEEVDEEAAVAALAEVDRRLPEGGGDELLDRIDRCRADLTMYRELDALERFRWTPINSRKPLNREVAREWPVAFARIGLEVGRQPAEAIARQIVNSLLRQRLIATLDTWLVLTPTAEVRAVLRVADPDPYRDAVRDALADRDAGRIAELTEQQALAGQPPGFVAALGQFDRLPVDRRRQMLEATLAGRPGNLGLLMSLGRTYLNNSTNWVPQRLRWYQAAVSAHPQSVLARVLLAWALQDEGKLEAAVIELTQAVEIDPTYSVAYQLLGLVQKRQGNSEAALAAHHRAVQLEPSNPEYLLNLGVALRDRKQIKEAVAAFEEGIRVAPRDPWCYSALGELQRDRGELDAAVATFNKAIAVAPNFSWAYSGLGLARSDKGDHQGGREACEKAIQLEPDNAPSYINLGVILYRMGDFRAAVSACREAIRLNPDDDGPYALLVASHLGLNRPRDAVAAARKALVDRPKNVKSGHLHYHLATALLQTGDLVGARAAATRAAAIDPQQFGLHAAMLWPTEPAPPPREVKR